MFTGGRDAVMTRAAGAQDLRVIDANRRCPGGFAVAILADISRLNMRWRLACRGRAVMAADTVVEDIAVIEYCRKPRDRIVAVIALVGGRHVSWCLAGGLDTVVTAYAIAGE